MLLAGTGTGGKCPERVSEPPLPDNEGKGLVGEGIRFKMALDRDRAPPPPVPTPTPSGSPPGKGGVACGGVKKKASRFSLSRVRKLSRSSTDSGHVGRTTSPIRDWRSCNKVKKVKIWLNQVMVINTKTHPLQGEISNWYWSLPLETTLLAINS